MTQDTMYMHYRPVDFDGQLEDPRGGATVAIRIVNHFQARVAIAWCSPEDVFNRKLGRIISTGRLDTVGRNTAEELTLDPEIGTKEQVAHFYQSAMSDMGYA